MGLFNVSVRFSSGSSRSLSLASSDSYLITPDQIIYNYQTYAGGLKKFYILDDAIIFIHF